MEPRIHDGDALLFDSDDTSPKDGVIYVVRYDGQYFVKRLAQYGKQWFLVSDNGSDPRWKKPIPVAANDIYANQNYMDLNRGHSHWHSSCCICQRKATG